MSRTKVSEWSATAASNTDINGININEGCPPSTLNNMGRELMSQVKKFQDGSSLDSLTNAGTLTSSGTLAVTGNLTLDGASGTSGQFLTSAGSGATPTWGSTFVAGMIMLWSGSTASIPAGWLLCNGTSSTPDLRDRFVVGAGSTYAVDATGGSANAVVVSHTHTASTASGGSHTHNINVYNGNDLNPPLNYIPATDDQTGTGTIPTASGGAHSHTVTVDSAGVSATNANLPPYYALAYIMKS